MVRTKDQILLEKAYLQIVNEQVDQGLELYHATTVDNMDSFVQNGIDIQRAGTLHGGAGAEQGKGFYVFKNKRNAINHSHGYVAGDDSIIVVIKAAELDVENFDIDYEAEGWLALKFLKHLITSQLINPRDYGIRVFDSGDVSITNGSRATGFGQLSNFDKQNDDININQATVLSKVFSLLKKNQPTFFAKFEKENLNQARVLKYNGTEKIWPIRIENPEGRVLWSKERDQGSWDDVWK